jgi:lipopolysaccharide heptosyltransferase II
VNRILAVKLADIGDLILITPALRALREAYPAAELDVLAPPRSAAALEGLPIINELITLNKYAFDTRRQALSPGRWGELFALARRLRGRHYDAVILFHHLSLRFGVLKHALLTLATGAPRRIGLDNGRGWFLTERVADEGFGARHEVWYWLALAAAAGAGRGDQAPLPRPEVAITGEDHDWAEELLPAVDRPTVALHPGSGGYSLARRWDVDKMAELGRRLGEEARLVIVGTPADGTDALAAGLGEQALNLGGRTTVGQLAAVLARCDLLVGADSGVLHVAATAGTPTVALFGPTNHRAWAPLLPAERLRIVRAGSACSPCAYTRLGLGAPEGCPQRTCMAMITVEEVQAAAESLLAGEGESEVAPAAAERWEGPPTVRILGVPVHAVTFQGLLEEIERLIGDGRAHQVATVNPEFVMAARRDPIFRVILERATLCLPDGVGLLWAARWLGGRLPERVTGSDGVPMIAGRAAEKGWRIFLLGAAPGVAERTAAILSGRYPGLQVAGTYAGSPAAEEEAGIVARVNAAEADILLVAYGAPKQDKWIARNLPRLRVGVAMGVGGSFDFISGEAARAPAWMRRWGLEWLHRLWREPWRWRRMVALPRFALAVLVDGLRGSRRQGTGDGSASGGDGGKRPA